MRVWKGFVGIAILMLACSGVAVFGDDTNSNSMGNDQVPPADQVEVPPAEEPAPETPVAAPAAPVTYGPLMQLLEKTPVGKPLEDLGFNFSGYVEAGYLYDMTVPNNQTPPRSAPGDSIFFAGPYKNEFMLNQLETNLEKTMPGLAKGNWDFGFDVEAGYGRDFFFTHSNGILDQHNKQGGTGNDDQLDLLQANVSLGIPVGNGIAISAGKFLTFMGYEKINPTQNIFYTHSYEFGYGKPFTMTGVIGSYTFGDISSNNTTTVSGGITRGWNQSTYDNNGEIDYVMQVKATTGSFDATFNMLIGPEGVLPYGPADHSHWWVVPEAILTFKASDQLSLSADFLYGSAPSLTQWFGAAVYAQYKLDPHLALGTRAEFYHDGRGVTTGVGGTDINYYEVTVGASVTPLPDSPWLQTFAIRPEVRFDAADQPVFDFSHHSEFTASIDMYYRI